MNYIDLLKSAYAPGIDGVTAGHLVLAKDYIIEGLDHTGVIITLFSELLYILYFTIQWLVLMINSSFPLAFYYLSWNSQTREPKV